MNKILILILIATSNIALGNGLSILQAVQKDDVKMVQSILNTTNVDQKLKDFWETIIHEACISSPESLLPLLEFGYKHDFHNLQDGTQIHNLQRILKLNDEKKITFCCKILLKFN